ncbi:MAG: hypothetical protein QF682_06040 [Candidatus Thermoplasmatota archaeon]|jgi:hypothetical protein|nr:hypothetical protein [Candidatus Thermoplasmatota archaeon]
MGDEELENTKRLNEKEASGPEEIGNAPPPTAPTTEPVQEPLQDEPVELSPVETPITQTTQELPDETSSSETEELTPVETNTTEAEVPNGEDEAPSITPELTPVETIVREAVQEPAVESETPTAEPEPTTQDEPAETETVQEPAVESEIPTAESESATQAEPAPTETIQEPAVESETPSAEPEPTTQDEPAETETVQEPGGESEAPPGSESPETLKPDEPEVVPEAKPAAKITNLSMIRAALAAAAKGERMKNIAKDLITTTRTLFGRVKGYGLELDEEKEIFKEAILAIKSEEYIRGAQLTNNVKKMLETAEEKFFFENASLSLSGVGDLINQARDVGIDVSILEDPFNKYKTNLEKKEFEKIEDFVTGVKEFSEQAASVLNPQIKNRLAEVITNELSTLPAIMERASSLDADISEEVSGLKAVEALRKEERRKEAYKNLMELKTSLATKINQRLKEKFSQQLEDAGSSLDSLKTLTGKEFAELHEQLENIKQLLDENNFESIESLIGEFSLGAENERNSFLFEKYSLQANEMEADITVIKKIGIVIDSGEELLANINENIVANDFDKVEEFIPRLSELIVNAKSVEARRLASKLLGSTKELYNTLNSAGVELGPAKDTFKQGILSIKSQDFVMGCQTLLGTKETLEEINKKYLSEVLATDIDTALQFYAGFEKIDYFADSHKEEVRKILEDAKALLEEGNLQDAQNKMNAFDEMKEEIKGQSEKFEEARAFSEKTNVLKQSAIELEVDIESEEALLNEASERMTDYMFEEAIVVFREIETQFNSKIDAKRQENAMSELEKAKSVYEPFKEQYPDPASIEALFATAGELIAKSEYDRSVETSQEIILMVEGGQRDKLVNEIKHIFSDFLEVIEECEELGVEVLRPQALLFKAKTSFERENFIKSKEQGLKAMEMALEKKKEFLKEKASVSAAELTEMLNEAVRLEIEHGAVIEMQTESLGFFEDEEFVKAREFSENAKIPLKELLDAKLKEIIKEEITFLRTSMGEAKNLSIDIQPEKEAIGSASTLKDEGKFYDAINSLRAIRETISAKITGDFKNNATDRRDEAAKKLETMEEEGCNIMEARSLLGEAAALIEVAKYRESLELIERASETADQLWEGFRQLKCQDLLKQMADFLSEIVEVTGGKVDLAGSNELLNSAIEKLKVKDFDSVETLVGEANSQADRLYYHYVIDSLLATHDFLLEVKNLGANVSRAQEMFTKAKASLEKKEYPLAIEHSNEAQEITKESRITYMKDVTEKNQKVASALADKLKVKGKDVTELEEVLAKVAQNVEEEDVTSAFELAKEAKVIAARFRDDFKKGTVGIILEECDKYLKDLEEFGVDASDIVAKLQPVETLITKKKFPEAQYITKEAKEILKERYTKHYHSLLTEKLKATGEYLEEISDKVDVTRPRLTLKEASEALKENNFKKCEELNKSAKAMGDKSKHAALVIEAANVLAYAGDIIRDGLRDGMDVSDMNATMMDASEAFEDREYQMVIDICATIGANVDRFKVDKLSNIAKVAVRAAKTVIEAAKAMKADVKEPTVQYKSAMQAYKEGKYQNSLDFAEEAQLTAIQKKDLRAATAVADNVRTKLDELSGNGLDISEAEEIFGTVEEAMASKDYDKVREIARDSIRKALAVSKFDKISNGIERSLEYVAFALDNEVFVKDYFQQPLEEEEEELIPEGKCPKCGQDVPEKAMFCLWCGNKLG